MTTYFAALCLLVAMAATGYSLGFAILYGQDKKASNASAGMILAAIGLASAFASARLL